MAATEVFLNLFDFHRTCFRAVAQIPFEQLLAHRKELESLTERLGVDGGDVTVEVSDNEKCGDDGKIDGQVTDRKKCGDDGTTDSVSALASNCLTLAFSLVIKTLKYKRADWKDTQEPKLLRYRYG